MRLTTSAIIVSVRAHGEHGAIVRALTPDDGIQAGYVRGGRSRALRPVLLAGNVVAAEFRARTEEQLAHLSAELAHSRAAVLAEPLAAAGMDWVTALTAAALPEAQPYPALYGALDGVLSAIEAAPSARAWSAATVRYELLVLNELGFGLDLSGCAVTFRSDDLGFVSPKSGRSVSRGAAGEYRDRLLRLPTFLTEREPEPPWNAILDGFRLTGHFLARDLLFGRQADVLAARERLVDRLTRIGLGGG